MNLCIDCIHFRRVEKFDSKGNCTHSQAVIAYSPIDGSATYKSAEEMRASLSLCRYSGVHFKSNIVEAKPTVWQNLTRWYR